jgi:hypothetical protein
MKVTIHLEMMENFKIIEDMDMIEIGNDKWQVINLSNGEVLHQGDIYSCENYMLSIHMMMTGI